MLAAGFELPENGSRQNIADAVFCKWDDRNGTWREIDYTGRECLESDTWQGFADSWSSDSKKQEKSK